MKISYFPLKFFFLLKYFMRYSRYLNHHRLTYYVFKGFCPFIIKCTIQNLTSKIDEVRLERLCQLNGPRGLLSKKKKKK